VCPTGIDIRNGPQLGCITCALCIDACDKVMGQIGRPRGLIDYVTHEDAANERAGKPVRPISKVLLRPRTLIYFSVWAAIGLAMLFALGQRARLVIEAAQDRGPVVVTLSDGMARNAWTIKLRNMESRPRTVVLTIAGLPGAQMWTDTTGRAAAASRVTVALPPDSTHRLRLYVAAASAGPAETGFILTATPVGEAAGSRAAQAAVRDLKFIRRQEG
jgi:polyferredoxin